MAHSVVPISEESDMGFSSSPIVQMGNFFILDSEKLKSNPFRELLHRDALDASHKRWATREKLSSLAHIPCAPRHEGNNSRLEQDKERALKQLADSSYKLRREVKLLGLERQRHQVEVTRRMHPSKDLCLHATRILSMEQRLGDNVTCFYLDRKVRYPARIRSSRCPTTTPAVLLARASLRRRDLSKFRVQTSEETPRFSTEPPRFYTELPRFSTEPSRFSTEASRFSTEPSRFSTEPPRFSTEPSRFYTETPRFSTEPPRFSTEPPRFSTEPPRFFTEPPRFSTEPPRFSTQPPRFSTEPPRFSTDPPRLRPNLAYPDKTRSTPAKPSPRANISRGGQHLPALAVHVNQCKSPANQDVPIQTVSQRRVTASDLGQQLQHPQVRLASRELTSTLAAMTGNTKSETGDVSDDRSCKNAPSGESSNVVGQLGDNCLRDKLENKIDSLPYSAQTHDRSSSQLLPLRTHAVSQNTHSTDRMTDGRGVSTNVRKPNMTGSFKKASSKELNNTFLASPDSQLPSSDDTHIKLNRPGEKSSSRAYSPVKSVKPLTNCVPNLEPPTHEVTGSPDVGQASKVKVQNSPARKIKYGWQFIRGRPVGERGTGACTSEDLVLRALTGVPLNNALASRVPMHAAARAMRHTATFKMFKVVEQLAHERTRYQRHQVELLKKEMNAEEEAIASCREVTVRRSSGETGS